MISVEQGSIKVNSAWIVAKSPNTIVIKVDLKAKYAEIYGFSNYEIMLGRSDRTLHYEKDCRSTHIRLKQPDDGKWEMDATISRYTLTIFMFKREETNECIYGQSL